MLKTFRVKILDKFHGFKTAFARHSSRPHVKELSLEDLILSISRSL